jgi:acyl-CoA synthetase (AMP-forming)/AMP-acid ligase II
MLIEVLRRAAADVPDQPVVISPEHALDYAGALSRAEALARGLAARSIDRFACLVDDVGDLVALLAAASATGAEPCVYPDRFGSGDDLGELAEPFGHEVVVTDRQLTGGSIETVELEQLMEDGGTLPPAPERAPVLVLTTGTTGRPKGVRHDWTRLVNTVRHPDETPGARWLLAYNLNQFAGIQILLHVLASRATLVAAASRQPRDAVVAMRDLAVTHASATPTFWRLAARLIDDKSASEMSLEQITIGGEAVPEALLRELQQRFPGVRISQIYGASEFGTAVSVRDGRPGLPLSVLDRPDDAKVRFQIVDGELHVRSRIGMLGYHGDDEVAEGWRPTGDLVEVRGDRIHFVGRSSEIINVGGVKVHPLPVEELVSALDGVELVHAYGRANPIAGQIVAVDVVARPGADTDALGAEIRAACEALPPAARPRRVRFVDELEVRDTKLARS